MKSFLIVSMLLASTASFAQSSSALLKEMKKKFESQKEMLSKTNVGMSRTILRSESKSCSFFVKSNETVLKVTKDTILTRVLETSNEAECYKGKSFAREYVNKLSLIKFSDYYKHFEAISKTTNSVKKVDENLYHLEFGTEPNKVTTLTFNLGRPLFFGSPARILSKNSETAVSEFRDRDISQFDLSNIAFCEDYSTECTEPGDYRHLLE